MHTAVKGFNPGDGAMVVATTPFAIGESNLPSRKAAIAGTTLDSPVEEEISQYRACGDRIG
ncbi:hypothetical protein [Rhodanobacter sp. DHG33]|uniref:hypothetical protein n=1 Tax=Rhodanobacter sp. DHG33 TaxID=2775921 RepID=UPI00177C1295|nr:hypothetical protein [Rhodanobacter sp. DHG33]MBD8898982.1 hypothetical protein [Rhodanobacter sp. DHG33]